MPENRDVYNLKMNEGNEAAWEQDWGAAIHAYREAIQEFPEDSEAHLQLGLTLTYAEHFDDALKVLTHAQQLSPNDPIPLEKTADVLEKLGRLQEAAQESINAAELYFQQHDPHKAIRSWERTTLLMPGLVDIHAKLAQIYEHVGQKSNAIRQYLILASIFTQQGDHDKALKAAQRASTIDPDNPASLNAIEALQSGSTFMIPPEKKPDLTDDFFALSLEEDDDEEVAQEVLDLLERLEKPGDLREETPSEPSPEVLFSAYFPFQGEPDTRYNLIIYAHIQDAMAQIVRDVQKFREELGGDIRAPKTAKQSARITVGTLVTITPECDELEIEPAAITKKWNGDWTRYDFDFQPTRDLVGDIVTIRVSVAVNGIEIAHINCPILISQQSTALLNEPVKNPLAAAKLTTVQAKMYQRVFVSYSRKDKAVVEAYRLAQLAIGNDVFMDTYSIRVGENWQAALAKAIDDADIFQLFWSEPASQSDNIRDEWDYALNHKCPDTRCESFIRPVFWEQPMPAPPGALGHLNFRYVPLTSTSIDS